MSSKKKLLSLFTLSLLIFQFTITTAFDDYNNDDDIDNIDDDLSELLALDEELEQGQKTESVRSSDTDVLAKAQRVVTELNHETSRRVIKDNEYVVVMGYAPWCDRSAELMPRFAQAAMILKEIGSRVFMAKIDGERYSKAAEAIGVKGFPTLLLFINGTSQAYTGGFTSEEIVTWTKKKTGEPVIRINSETDAKEFLTKHSIFVVGLFNKFEGSNYEAFLKAAAIDSEIQFVETSSYNVASVLFPDIKPSSPFLGFVKNEPERYTTFEGTFETEKILNFVDINKFPLVTTVTDQNSVRVYSSPVKLQVYIFADADDFKNLLESLQNIARKLKSQVMLVHADIKDENLGKPFLTMFGLEDSEDTVVAAFDNKIGSKYLLESARSPRKIEEFCFGLLRGTLMPFYKSQPAPDNKDGTILTVVGKTFDDLVLSSPKNVLLEVYTPWCMNCETLAKNVEKLAKHFKGLDNLVFARIDVSANEHPNLQVDDYPTLMLYLAGNKSTPIKLSTKSGLKELAALINKNLKSQQHHATKEEL